MSDELLHYGILRRSGRYPWGSGKDPYQRSMSFNSIYADSKKKGWSDSDFCKAYGLNVRELREIKSLNKQVIYQHDQPMAIKLKEKGYSNVAIAKRLGVSEGKVRLLLKDTQKLKNDQRQNTVDMLKKSVDKNTYIDVGKGVESMIGVTKTSLNRALSVLKQEGYEVLNISIDQVTTDKKTHMKVLVPSGVTGSDVHKNISSITTPIGYTTDLGSTYNYTGPIKIIDPKRVYIRYGDQGGTDRDGLIQIRPGVKDLDLGGSNYAQVRIAAGKGYMKGMAVYGYGDDIPKGYDVVYNTNKKTGTDFLSVLKPLKTNPKTGEIDSNNPFGATFRNNNGKKKEKDWSALNVVNEEGDWLKWSKTLPSQFLGKQKESLAKKQLDLAYSQMREELDKISKLTNPILKKHMLLELGDQCDSAAVFMKGAALPRQGSYVILPFPELKPNEIYCPQFENGEKVVAVRYPHGGTFEIPELVVNNKKPKIAKVLGTARDAVGIHPKTAEILSGADFDGDTVTIIPNSDGKISTSKPLKGLEGFDPKARYPKYEGMKPISEAKKQKEMGVVSNLISDMSLKKASPDELARAVRHSMVVIDAAKHSLDYKQSYIDNGIKELKNKYQTDTITGQKSGSSTILSRAKSPVYINARKDRYDIDPETGEKIWYEDTTKRKKVKSALMAETKDAMKLVSDQKRPMEVIYANHANRLKALGNQARKEYLSVKPGTYSPQAKKEYAKEVASLQEKLKAANSRKPGERKAQITAKTIVDMYIENNPSLKDDKDALKKLKARELSAARIRFGVPKESLIISPDEWKAIQAGAVSNSFQEELFRLADPDALRALATPRPGVSVPPAKVARAKALLAAGKTQAEVAQIVGVSVSTINKLI